MKGGERREKPFEVATCMLLWISLLALVVDFLHSPSTFGLHHSHALSQRKCSHQRQYTYTHAWRNLSLSSDLRAKVEIIAAPSAS